MSGEENFRKTLNDRLNTREFTFEESDWAAADKFITAARRKRRLRPLYWILPVLFGVGTTVLLLPEKTSTEISAVKPQEQQTYSKPLPKPAAEKKTPEQKTIEAQTGHVADSNPERSEVTKTPATKPARATTPAAPQAAAPVQADDVRQPAQDPNIAKQNTQPEVKTYIEPEAKGEKLATENQPENKPEQPATDLVNKQEEAEKPTDDRTINEKNAVVAASEPATQTPAEEKNESAAPVTKPVATETAAPQENKSEPVATNSTTAATATSIAATAPASVASPETALPDTDYVALQRPLLTFEAGTLLNRGWNSGENKEAGGFNPLVGITYFQNLNSKIAISAGLQYYSIANLKASSYTSRTVRYGLGEQSDISTYTPTKLHYMALPLQINYRLGALNVVGLGLNVGYLLTVDVSLEQYTQTAHGTSAHRSSNERGYMQGFKPFDNQLSIFYRRRFLTSFFAGAEFYYGLTNVKDSFFGASGKEKNMGAKLTVGYYILKSK